MTRHKPDRLTLDAMVLGTDTDEDTGAWDTVLAHPDAASIWQEAVDRREALDRSSSRFLAYPWLARSWLAIKALGRKTRHLPSQLAQVRPAPSSSLLAALLGPSEGAPSRQLQLEWGKVSEFPVRLYEIVEVVLPGEARHLRVYFQTSTDSGYLESRRWKLERGDAPVLLAVVDSRQIDADVAEALSSGTVAAGVVLMEGDGEP